MKDNSFGKNRGCFVLHCAECLPIEMIVRKNICDKKAGIPGVNSTPFVRQYGILITSGVLIYGKRDTKQQIHRRMQARSRGNYAPREVKS